MRYNGETINMKQGRPDITVSELITILESNMDSNFEENCNGPPADVESDDSSYWIAALSVLVLIVVGLLVIIYLLRKKLEQKRQLEESFLLRSTEQELRLSKLQLKN